jgi:AcrR family transcriptional regulator
MSDRREQILTAALQLWEERGESFTMDELAAKSKVPRAALYRLFAKKGEVLKALTQEKNVQGLTEESLDISQRIVEAARREFMKHGVQVTLEQIAEAAGVGVATVYRRYKDKAGLFRAAGEEQPIRKSLLSIEFDPKQDPTAQLTALVEQMLESLHEYGPAMLVMIRDIQSQPDNMAQYFLNRQNRTYQLLGAHLAKLMELGFLQKKQPEECAVSLMALCFFASYLGPTMNMSEYKGPKHHAAFIVSLFLDGLRA